MPHRLQPIAPTIFLVQGKNRGRFPNSHSILILTAPRDAVLIDTGCGIEILKGLAKQYDIELIINSHTHPDHSAGNWLFQDRVESIIVPKEGFSTSGDILALSERFTEPGYLAEYWRGLVGGEFMHFKECQPTTPYDEQTIFEFEDISLLPVHTPGHSIDHYCLYEPTGQILFSFDYDMTPFGPWYGHRESSLPDVRNSLSRLQELDIQILVTAHRGILTDHIDSHFEQFAQKIDEREERIKQLIQDGVNSLAQLVDRAPIYKEFPYAEPLLRYWEGQMIKKHLDELRVKGELPEHFP